MPLDLRQHREVVPRNLSEEPGMLMPASSEMPPPLEMPLNLKKPTVGDDLQSLDSASTLTAVDAATTDSVHHPGSSRFKPEEVSVSHEPLVYSSTGTAKTINSDGITCHPGGPGPMPEPLSDLKSAPSEPKVSQALSSP